MEMMGLNLSQMTPPSPLQGGDTAPTIYLWIQNWVAESAIRPVPLPFPFGLSENIFIQADHQTFNRLFWCARGYKIQPGPQGRPRHVVLTNSRLFLFPKVLFTSSRPEIHPIPFNPICPPATVLHPSLTCYLKRKLSLSSLFGHHARRAEFTSVFLSVVTWTSNNEQPLN